MGSVHPQAQAQAQRVVDDARYRTACVLLQLYYCPVRHHRRPQRALRVHPTRKRSAGELRFAKATLAVPASAVFVTRP